MQNGSSIAWKIHAERVLLLGWGRAILLQFAHPLVAAGVADHARLRASPDGALQRLHRTLNAMLVLTFGTWEEATRVARHINAIHDYVHGRLREAAGIFPGGTPYSAHDPELLRWVHATLLDSFPLAYEVFVGPLMAQERDQYCTESRVMELHFGLPEGYLPGSAAELAAYMDGMMQSGQITVAETARALAGDVLRPEAPLWLQPASWLSRLATIGLLPPALRTAYRLPWTARDEVVLRATARGIRRLLPLVPPAVRYWPVARRRLAETARSDAAARPTEYSASARQRTP